MATVDRALWQKIIHRVISTGGNIIRPWFTELEPISLEHGLLEILAPGRREHNYCRKHATRLFTEAAQSATGRLVGVCFLTKAPSHAESASDDVVGLEDNLNAPEFSETIQSVDVIL